MDRSPQMQDAHHHPLHLGLTHPTVFSIEPGDVKDQLFVDEPADGSTVAIPEKIEQDEERWARLPEAQPGIPGER